MDLNRVKPGQPGYDPTTLYISPAQFKGMTPAEAQYWEIKQLNMGQVLLFKIGKFYEMFDDGERRDLTKAEENAVGTFFQQAHHLSLFSFLSLEFSQTSRCRRWCERARSLLHGKSEASARRIS